MKTPITTSTPDPLSSLRPVLLTIGVALIVAGAVVLLYLGWIVWQVLNNPGEVAIVQFVLEHVRAGDQAIYGTMYNPQLQQDIKFEMNLSEAMRLMSFTVAGLAILGIASGILRTLITSGVKIVELAVKPVRQNKPKNA